MTVVAAWILDPVTCVGMVVANQVIIDAVDEGAATHQPSCERLRHALLWRNAHTTVHPSRDRRGRSNPLGSSLMRTVTPGATATGLVSF